MYCGGTQNYLIASGIVSSGQLPRFKRGAIKGLVYIRRFLPIEPARSNTTATPQLSPLVATMYLFQATCSQATALRAAVYLQNGAIVQLSDPGNYRAGASSVMVVLK
jgi:hypothetical protein